MKNFGLGQLVLVNPQCDHLGGEARLMAVRAADLLEQARCVASLPEALVGVQRAIATTGIDHDFPTPLESPRQVLPWLLQRPVDSPAPAPSTAATSLSAALIFGREDNGLTTQELHYAQRLLHIPSDDGYTSLNLAQAVAVCCYELNCYELNCYELNCDELNCDELDCYEQSCHKLSPIAATPQSPEPRSLPPANSPTSTTIPLTAPPAPQEELEGLYQQLEALLLHIGYLYPHTAASRMQHFRRLSHRAQPSSHEVRMLRGILRQTAWALQQARANHKADR
jgi:tRNA/rRNA methyltransferase